MNAPASISVLTADRDAQALLAICHDRRWNLLQRFARLEIALGHRLDTPPKTFGLKLRAWIKTDAAFKRFERLIPARNLIAHAAVHCVQIESVTYALWEIADGTGELNCAKFDKHSLNKWGRQISALLDEAIAKA